MSRGVRLKFRRQLSRRLNGINFRLLVNEIYSEFEFEIMDLETACHDLREPGVIDEKILYNAIIDQGPKGEEGRLFQEQGIVYSQITHLRLDFLNILKIDHLWMMTGLTKLQLCNNAIEKIENLDVLVNLTELDLSFNYIEKIENLENLLELEVLTFYQNKIEVIENMHFLTKLTVFSIGNNKIKDYDSIVYMRKFESLKSFNMAGNPVCEDAKFNKFIAAYLPQLVYYEYRMISKQEKEEARDLFLKELLKIERDEAEKREYIMAKKKEEKDEMLNAEAFVEYLGGNQLFLSMFEKDAECKLLFTMGEPALDIYNEFKQNFTEMTKEMHRFGLEQLEVRKQEIALYNKFIGKAKDNVLKESREIVENFLEQKAFFFEQIRGSHTEMEEMVVEADEENDLSVRVHEVNEEFKELCNETWKELMKRELNLLEAMEEVNATFERAMTELVNQFVEGIQAMFVQLRLMQCSFNEALGEAATKFLASYAIAKNTQRMSHSFKAVPKELINVLQDKEILTNTLTTSHDYHLMIIDQREDKLVSGVKTWLANLTETMVNNEINRNRATITEINHFLDVQRSKFHEVASQVGLALLPKDIQDVLQL